MTDADATPDPTLPAGSFSAWLAGMRRALAGGTGDPVPCDGCTACCTSSQFVHIGPDETETLARIPAALLFAAPRLPRGNVLLGYDEKGHCPMLVEGACSIYQHRPRTCRTYDCRVFPAAGVGAGVGVVDDKPAIARRARRWRFDFPADADHVEHDAVRAAARFVEEHGDALPDGAAPTSATQLAVLAVQLGDAFLGHDPATGAQVVVADPDPEKVRTALTSTRHGRREDRRNAGGSAA